MKALIRTILRLLILPLLVVTAAAAEITAGPSVDWKAGVATIRWTTDVDCGTVVKYGTNPNNLNHREEGPLGSAHEVRLTGLTEGRTYYYSVGTTKRLLKAGQFTAGAAVAPGKGAPAPPPPAQPPATPKPTPPPPPPAPSSRQTWGDPSSLADHYARHGRDFGATSAEDYARKAWEFYQRAIDEGLPAKIDSEGVIRIYEARTRSFAACNPNGTTKTFFKPQRPDYFRDQPGRLVRLKRPEPVRP